MTFNGSPTPGLDATLGLQAFVKSVDARGGIDGYKLVYKFCSLGPSLQSESPNLSATCAHEAVSNHVTAVVGTFDAFDNVAMPILQAAGIPEIGNFPESDIDFTSKWSTPLLASTEVLSAGAAQELIQVAHCKTIGYIALQGAPTEPESARGITAVAKAFNVKFPAPQLVPSTVSDYGPAVTTLKSKGVDCLVDGFQSPQDTQPLARAVSQAGIAHLGMISTNVPTTVLKAMGSAANGIYAIESSNQDALVNNFHPGKINAAERQMLSDFKKYEPAAMTMNPLNYPDWGAGQIFAQVLRAIVAKHEPVNHANIEKTVNSITVNPGVFPPSNFSKPGPVPGEPRVHATTLNYLKIINDTLTPLDRKNHNVGPALLKFG
ncbi:MAG: ABC transporter substrate-binding protein [Acidimicrobiaceae bacterium]|nr:ABC transporter substrate-binding protein [Acidimicrobiaceae bacterium]MBO0747873.1 ABC transporter substrate-binding protein [Acidimicrobiaceae bacterium]